MDNFPIADEEDLERILLAHSPKFQALLKAAEQRAAENETIEHEDFWKLVDEEG